MTALIKNIGDVYRRISYAEMRSGRSPDAVTLIAVTKEVSAEKIKEAIETGLRAFGESRVQEAERKITELKGISDNIKWHMIGHLQKNKAKTAVGLFDLIHSVDSIELMGLINKYAQEKGKAQRVLIEVKLSHETSKHGIEKDEIEKLLKAGEAMQNIRIQGLMTVPAYSEDPEGSRPYYRELKGLADTYSLRELSMGMTNDFEVAVEEGATMVRIGTAIFGERSISREKGKA